MSGVASELAGSQIDTVAKTLRGGGFRILARVSDTNRATDLAAELNSACLVVLRCAAHATPQDHIALATMISQGDFIWGAIVYSESATPDPLGLIESFHVDQLDQLISRLAELRGAFHEAG